MPLSRLHVFAFALCGSLLPLFGCGEEGRTPSNDVCNPPDEPGANGFVAPFDDAATCLPRSFGQNGDTTCAIVEARLSPCSCEAAEGLRVAPKSLDVAVRRQLSEENNGDATGTSCHELCVCELKQLDGAALAGCQNDVSASEPPGFCYVDPAAGVGAEALVSDCPVSSQRRFRFLGSRAPGDGDRWFLSCLGARTLKTKL